MSTSPALTQDRIRAAVDELAQALLEATGNPVEPVPDRLLSIPEAADRLGIGRTRLYGELTSGRIRSVSVGRRRLVPTSALAEYVRSA